ncbi:phospholipid/cholesterol/gamma-HCH transport system permease protein [Halomonas shengliensis]|uniref:Phospholipid/cholesterol/gamma-HCH transport system permease protein n=1 Tax=Halomonas shengliensis TaxID=419597 RepID=A0A1H0DRK5_9GAMM|nr:MlaE family lipid ABC transporter permease subunit [Halomonas shengliensis]SDN72782.1 phospholipid/cholesterol/gamma-HCH transport system permease protein [Halomonas shengliensis]
MAAGPGELTLAPGPACPHGDWTLAHHARLRRRVDEAHRVRAEAPVDLAEIGALDTAGAALLAELTGAERLAGIDDWAPALPAERRALLRAVGEALTRCEAPARPRRHPLRGPLADIGQRVAGIAHQQKLLLGFIGQVLATLAATLLRPRRWRLTSVVAQVHQTGLDALPIVALLTFLVGAVVAFLGATVLSDFGATLYTVHLVAYAFLREFGVILAAILLAGRTASAFTAQLGAMKANEELDALRTLGLDPVELLVLPRVVALTISLPILTFVGMLSGILGGALVCLVALDISAVQFLAILERDIAVQHFLVGLGKAPLFAFVVAVIGCLEGFKVSGSAQSVGEHTTSSVVQSIFMVILLDAVAALFCMEMGW